MAYEAIAKMNHEGLVSAKAKEEYSDADLFKAYRKSLAKGMLKVMSKMGISTLQSYKGAQVCGWLGCLRCWLAVSCRFVDCFDEFYRISFRPLRTSLSSNHHCLCFLVFIVSYMKLKFNW